MADVPGGPLPPPPPPPPGSPPGPGGIRPRGLGEILSGAFEVYRGNAANLLLIVSLVVVPLSFLSALAGHAVAPTKEHTAVIFGRTVTVVEARSFFVVLIAGLIAAAILVIIWAVLQAAITRAAAQATIGDPIDVEGSYRWGLKRFGSVLLVALLVGLTVGIGFLLLIIPGIVFLAFFAVSVPALVVENRRGTDAMRRSWALVSGHFWHALGTIVVAMIIAGVVSGIIGAIGGSNWFLRWIFTAIAQIVTVPFTSLVGVLLYLDLRARKEALTADALRREMATNE
jgi:hypothetical protein